MEVNKIILMEAIENLADLMDIVEIFTKVLDETDFDIDQIFMYCWW